MSVNLWETNAVNTRVILLTNWKWLSGAESNWVLLKSPIGSFEQSKKQMVFKGL